MWINLLATIAILIASFDDSSAHPFCQSTSIDGIFSYSNRVFVFSRPNTVYRVYRSNGQWTSDVRNISQMFNGSLQTFDCGFSIDEPIACTGIYDPYCDKKVNIFNMTIIFITNGNRYQCYRPSHDGLDFIPIREYIMLRLMPFNARASGGPVDELALFARGVVPTAAVYNPPESDLALTSDQDLAGGNVFTNIWKIGINQDPINLRAKGAFRIDGTAYFIIDGSQLYQLQLVGIVEYGYQLVPTSLTVKSFFGCDLISPTTTIGSTASDTDASETEDPVVNPTNLPPEPSSNDDGQPVEVGTDGEGSSMLSIIIFAIVGVLILVVAVGAVVGYVTIRNKQTDKPKAHPLGQVCKSQDNNNETTSVCSMLSSVRTINSFTGVELSPSKQALNKQAKTKAN